MSTKKQVTIYLNEENENFITNASSDLGITRNGYVNMLIHNLIKNNGNS